MQPIINTLLDPIVNFGKVTVSTGYDSAATEIVLITGHGFKLPNPLYDGSFNLVWFDNSTYSDPADDPNVEIVRCIARSDDTLILMRHEEGTSASNKNIPGKIYKMILSPTKKIIDDIQLEYQSGLNTHSALNTNVHGIGLDTIDGVNARNIAISTHSSTVSNVHGFDISGDAPAQLHGISRHTGTIGTWANIDKTISNIGDITTRSHSSLTDIGSYTHTQIDTKITDSINHIAANGTSVHNLGTMSTQAANNVAITGGSITGITNVGIGIGSPTAKLHIGGTVGVDGIKFPDGTLQTTASTVVSTGYAYGITPTASGWTINPSPLSEVTNNNEVDFSQVGQTPVSGTCYVTVDLGQILARTIAYRFKFSPWYGYGSPNSISGGIQISSDNSSWTTLYSNSTVYNMIEVVDSIVRQGFRYIRCYATGGGTNDRGKLIQFSLAVI